MGKAAWGALMGLGQGISQYGTAMGANALEEQRAKREFDRQKSLQEISQRYRRDFAIEQLDPNTELGRLTQENQDRSLKQQFDPNDPMFQMAEARRKELLAEKVDPNNPIYQQTETERKRLADEAQANAEALRKIPYGGASSASGIISDINPANFTPESYSAWLAEVAGLINDGMEPEQAKVQAKAILVPHQTSSPEGETAVSKLIMEDFQTFTKDNQTVEDMQLALMDKGFTEADVAGKTMKQLEDMAAKAIEDKYSRFRPQPGLMNQSMMPGQAPAIGQPGSSRENPVDVTPSSPRPPSGTWVRNPNGQVVQVP